MSAFLHQPSQLITITIIFSHHGVLSVTFPSRNTSGSIFSIARPFVSYTAPPHYPAAASSWPKRTAWETKLNRKTWRPKTKTRHTRQHSHGQWTDKWCIRSAHRTTPLTEGSWTPPHRCLPLSNTGGIRRKSTSFTICVSNKVAAT